jgi:hypothetical protein
MDGEAITKVCDMIRYIVQNANPINRALVKNPLSETEGEKAIAPQFSVQ